MFFYNSDSFYHILINLRPSVLCTSVVPHAACYAVISLVTPGLAQLGWLDRSHNELISTLSFILAFLLAFDLQYGLSHFENAVSVVTSLQSESKKVMMRALAYTSPDDELAVESMRKIRRLLTLLLLFVRARVRSRHTSEDEAALPDAEHLANLCDAGALSAEEMAHFKVPVRKSVRGAESSGCYPSQGRSHLAVQLLYAEVNELHRQGRFGSSNHWAALDSSVATIEDSISRLEMLLGRSLPFVYAHFIKMMISSYLLIFPFSVADSLQWMTPLATLGVSIAILAIDKVSATLLQPFTADMLYGIDLEKRIRRTDKELASLVGVWQSRAQLHFDLFPETAKRAMVAAGQSAFHRSWPRRQQRQWRRKRQHLEELLRRSVFVEHGPTQPDTPARTVASALRRHNWTTAGRGLVGLVSLRKLRSGGGAAVRPECSGSRPAESSIGYGARARRPSAGGTSSPAAIQAEVSSKLMVPDADALHLVEEDHNEPQEATTGV